MMVIAVTGSMAMGKSEVVTVLHDQGLPVFDADKEVHRLYDSAEGVALLQPLAPAAIHNGRVDRTELSRLIVKNPALLTQLEEIIHAEIASRRRAFIAEAERNGHGCVVVDVPLLFETAGDKNVDVSIVVSAPAHLQRQRALSRPGMTEAKLGVILARQMPDQEKQKRADFVIHNTGSLDALRMATLSVLAAIKKEHTL
jgi:dephospho-CoA kinase